MGLWRWAAIAARSRPRSRQKQGRVAQSSSQLSPAGGEPGERGDLDAAVAANARTQAQPGGVLDSGRGLGEGRQDQGGGRCLMTSERQGGPTCLDCRRHVSPPNGSGRFIDARGHAVARPTLTSAAQAATSALRRRCVSPPPAMARRMIAPITATARELMVSPVGRQSTRSSSRSVTGSDRAVCRCKAPVRIEPWHPG